MTHRVLHPICMPCPTSAPLSGDVSYGHVPRQLPVLVFVMPMPLRALQLQASVDVLRAMDVISRVDSEFNASFRSSATRMWGSYVYSALVGYQTSDIRLLWTIITKP